jgi:polyisoprenoid-binding protein YceI
MRFAPLFSDRVRRSIIGVVALAAVPYGALLQAQTPPPPANPKPAAAQSGDYAVEPSHTRVGFTVSHMGFTDWYGDFTNVSGGLHLDTRNVAASQVDVTIPVASVTTTNATLDGELRSADWFDANRYPTIHFVSTKVVKTGPRTARISGNLTFHGVTRPATLDASFNASGVNPQSKGYTVGFNAATRIKRSDFGVKTYVPLISDDVTIRISAAFERKS